MENNFFIGKNRTDIHNHPNNIAVFCHALQKMALAAFACFGRLADTCVVNIHHFDHRINEQRKDEFGQLYADFDAMASALQEREAGLDRTVIQPAARAAGGRPGSVRPGNNP